MNKLLNLRELVKVWEFEEQRPFSGWDFSYLKGRMLEEEPPWSYLKQAAHLMQQSSAMLDMGTGGGERLIELHANWPEKVVVTEDYPPNIKLAKGCLEPLGVKVVNVSLTRHGVMPFENGEFDLVINRHSGMNCNEIARVLTIDGLFLTQQIHGLWAQDLLSEFGVNPQWPDATPEFYISWLQSVGMDIQEMKTWQGHLVFYDVGAIVYYLKAVPWLVPGFSVKRHTDNLVQLEERLRYQEKLVFEARKYLIEARKVA